MDSVFMKRAVLAFIVFRILVSGLEEYMILSTAWIYIQSLGQDHLFVGITLASYAAAVVIFTPILCKLTDRYRCPKVTLLFCHLLRVCGNALYSVSLSPHYALAGRIICGLSAASDVMLLGELARTTKVRHRAKVFFILDGIYLLGCALGPIFATILTFSLNIYQWRITPENSPAFALAIIWLAIFILTMVLPWNFSKDEDTSNEQLLLTPSGLFVDSFEEDPQKTAVDKSQILCLISYIFFICFFGASVGFYTPILATQLFSLRQFHINLLFATALLFQMVLYLLSYIFHARLNERILLLLAMFLQAIPLSIIGIFGINWGNNYVYLLFVLIVFGTPQVAFTLASSLLSKIVNPQLIAYYQRLAYTSLYTAMVFGRILAACFFGKSLLAWLALQLGFLWLMMTISYTLVFFMKY